MQMIAVFISLGLNFGLMYSRMKPWCTDKLRWLASGIVFGVGIVGFLTLPCQDDDRCLVSSGVLLAPLGFNVYDRVLKKMSFKSQGRDFLLYLKGGRRCFLTVGRE